MVRNEMSDERFETVLDFFEKVFRNPDRYPDKAVVLPMHDSEITSVFTQKRLEIIELIKKGKANTATALARITGRKVEGVIRDLSLLKAMHVVQQEKKGKEMVLSVKQDFLVVPIVGSMTVAELKRKAKASVTVKHAQLSDKQRNR